MRLIAIDPGKSGALAFSPNGVDVVTHPSDRTDPLEALSDAIAGAEGPVVCYVEEVNGFIKGNPTPGSAMFSFGRNFGFWLGLLCALRVRTILVKPQAWQKGLPGLQGRKGPERKRALKDEAVRRFPQVKVTLGNADALLLLDYAKRSEAA
jgi:hypothetical protein